MRHLVIIAVAWAALSAGPDATARAAEVPADTTAPHTLDDYLRLARASNAGLQASVARSRASRERVGVVQGMPDPRLLYGYTFEAEESGHTPSEKGRSELALAQDIPFFGKRGLRGEVAARQAGMDARMTDAMALDLDFEVKSTFYEYVGLTEVALVLDSESDLLRRMREVAQVRYEAGKAEQQEVLKTELALSQLADELTLNRRQVRAVRARLNELIGRDAGSPLPQPAWALPDTSAWGGSALADTARVLRPEVAAAREEMAMADAAHRLAKKEYMPDFMLGLTWEFGGREDDLGEQMEDEWRVMAGVDLPIWLGKRRAMVREAEAMQSSAGHRLQAESLRVSREVEAAREAARTAAERLERFAHVILPQAEAAFASSEAGYRTGRVDFLDYLDSERMLLEMRRDYAMVIADLGMQVAALERAVGIGRAANAARENQP